jgi:hypothetical protein
MNAEPAEKFKEDTNMDTKITKKDLQEHFRKHDTLTLYKPDGTTISFTKHFTLALSGGYSKFTFNTYDELLAFYHKKHLNQKPHIDIG